jgi:hypothetical protein
MKIKMFTDTIALAIYTFAAGILAGIVLSSYL